MPLSLHFVTTSNYMLSIITAVHNQLEMNTIFWEFLSKNTFHPFELIVIDNASTDGSAEFFESIGAKVIRNTSNYSYPYTQNQGIRVANFKVFAFLNNDIIVGVHWDKICLETMEHQGLDVATPAGIERLETVERTKSMNRRWNRIRNVIGFFGIGRKSLLLMWKAMYGDWDQFCAERRQRFGYEVLEGFVGNSVIMNSRAVEILGFWDERIQGADWDLYARSKQRSIAFGDIKPVHVVLGAFNHHFVRLTSKSKPPRFADAEKIISVEKKWGKELAPLLADLPA